MGVVLSPVPCAGGKGDALLYPLTHFQKCTRTSAFQNIHPSIKTHSNWVQDLEAVVGFEWVESSLDTNAAPG